MKYPNIKKIEKKVHHLNAKIIVKYYFFFAANGVWILLIIKILISVLLNDSSVLITFCSEENSASSSDDSKVVVKRAETALGIVKVIQEEEPGINIGEDENPDDCKTIKNTIETAVGKKMDNLVIVCDTNEKRSELIKEKISEGIYDGMKEGVSNRTKGILNPQDVQEMQDDSDSDSSEGCRIS